MLNPTHLHYVYRYFDEADDLLYVGETTDPARRAQDHANSQDWWPEVARITVDVFTDASSARAEEKRAIADERPRYNVVGRARAFERDRADRRRRWTDDPVTASRRERRRERRRVARLERLADEVKQSRRPQWRLHHVVTVPPYVIYRLLVRFPLLLLQPLVREVMQRWGLRLGLLTIDEVDEVCPGNLRWVIENHDRLARRQDRFYREVNFYAQRHRDRVEQLAELRQEHEERWWGEWSPAAEGDPGADEIA